MRSNIVDMIGRRFGRLLVKERAENIGRGTAWLCECTCKNITIVARRSLCYGTTHSCGCLQREVTAQLKFKHGKSRSKEYRAWVSMRRRCLTESDPFYKNYGGRGIKVCDRWVNDFSAFYADMGNCPDKNSSLDRISNNGHYEPSNCRWATAKQQANNRTNTKPKSSHVELAKKLQEYKNTHNNTNPDEIVINEETLSKLLSELASAGSTETQHNAETNELKFFGIPVKVTGQTLLFSI